MIIIIINSIVITRVIGACSSDSLGASNGHESRPTDRPTDRQDRPDETRPDRPTRPSPKTTPRNHRHCTGKHAPRARPQNPSCLDTKVADKKKARVSCTSGGGFKKKPPPPTTGGRAEARSPPLPILGRVGGQKAARAPQSTQKGTGHYVQKNVWLQSQNRDQETREWEQKTWKASSSWATRHHTRERETQAAPKNRKKTTAPRPLGAQNKVCVAWTWSSEMASEKNHLLKPPASRA